jgi:hypothetical protein
MGVSKALESNQAPWRSHRDIAVCAGSSGLLARGHLHVLDDVVEV